MAIYVKTNATVTESDFPNGSPSRGIHPARIDELQAHLIAGYGWHYSPLISTWQDSLNSVWIPILLPPWCGSIAVAVKAAMQDENDLITMRLYECDGIGGTTLISLGDIEFTPSELGVYGAIPATWDEWQGIPWVGGGSLGYAAPAATGIGVIQLTPGNAWRRCMIEVDPSSTELHGFWFRPLCSSTPVPVGG